jgi:hypothetical protein
MTVIKVDRTYPVGSWQQPNLKRTMDAPPSQGNLILAQVDIT